MTLTPTTSQPRPLMRPGAADWDEDPPEVISMDILDDPQAPA